MNPIVSTLIIELFRLWCIDIYTDEPPQNTVQMHEQFRYESDIRLPKLRIKWYIYTHTPRTKIKIRC